jgi:hypothetical protein
LAGGLLLAGCSAAGAGEEGSALGQARQALTANDVCVLAELRALRIGDRSLVQGRTAAAILDLGLDGRINGNTLVNGNGVLRDRARVTGDLTLAGTLTRGNGAVVTGTLRQNTPVTLPALFSQAIPAGDEPVSIGPGADTRLLNGGYGDVVIRSRSTVRLSGTYDVTSFTVEPDVTLIEDPAGSGVQINSVGPIAFGDRSALRATDPAGVSIYSGGTSFTVGTSASITGVIDAPIATISVGSRARVNGCVGGDEINLAPDSTIASSNPTATLPLRP